MPAKLIAALRPMLPSDGPILAAIFRAAIEGVASEDYSAAQCEAWISSADNEASFAGRLKDQLTLIATVDREPAGFSSLQDNTRLDMLYVRPEFGRKGIASALVDALEILAASRGTTVLSVDASDSARDFFARRGYVALRRNTVQVGGEWLGNTSMEKKLERMQRGALQ